MKCVALIAPAAFPNKPAEMEREILVKNVILMAGTPIAQ
jgi:hypothetical protein